MRACRDVQQDSPWGVVKTSTRKKATTSNKATIKNATKKAVIKNATKKAKKAATKKGEGEE